jgi:hypothetical protein
MFDIFKKKKPVEYRSNDYYWHTADGRDIQITDLTDDHLINILKYGMCLNRVPFIILKELADRKLLPTISDEIQPRPGYKTPQQLHDDVKLVD